MGSLFKRFMELVVSQGKKLAKMSQQKISKSRNFQFGLGLVNHE